MNTKKKVSILIIATVTAIIAGKAVFGSNENREQEMTTETGDAENTYTVRSILVERKDLREFIELNGLIDAEDTVEVYPEIGGKYQNQRVQLGTKVEKGDIIAEVDPSRPGSPYSMSPIRAPISGTVTSLNRRPGSTLTTETVVAKIGDIDHLQVRVQIPEREIANMIIGLPAIVTVEAYPDATFPASVYRLSPLVDPISHTKDVCLRFELDDPRINAGMFARVTLFTKTHRQCIAIPEDSIISWNESSIVYVAGQDNIAVKKEITAGIRIDGLAIVEKGLSPGERLIVQGNSVLSDGAKIRDLSTHIKTITVEGTTDE